jgi:hypothetical protein
VRLDKLRPPARDRFRLLLDTLFGIMLGPIHADPRAGTSTGPWNGSCT